MSSMRPTLPILLCLGAALAPRAGADQFEPRVHLRAQAPVPADPFAPLAISRDGRALAHWHEEAIAIRNPDLEQVALVRHAARVEALVFSRSGHDLFVGDADGVVTCYQWRQGKKRWSQTLKGPIGTLDLPPKDELLAATAGAKVSLLEVKTGAILGNAGIKPSGYETRGRKVPIARFLPGANLVLAAVERNQVKLHPIDAQGGFGKAKPTAVKLEGPAWTASRMAVVPGLLVGTKSGLCVVYADGKLEVVVKKLAAGPPIQLCSGGARQLAGLAEDRFRVLVFGRPRFAVKATHRLGGRTIERIAFSAPNKLYVVAHDGSRKPRGFLDALDAKSGTANTGPLPANASDLRTLADGRVSALVRQEEDAPAVTLWAWAAETGPRRLGRYAGLLVAEDAQCLLIKSEGALSLVFRGDGKARLLTAPADALQAEVVEVHHGRFLLWQKSGRYVFWDASTGKTLGGWEAQARKAIGITPAGDRVIRLLRDALICEKTAGGALWSQTVPTEVSARALEVSPDGQRLNVIGLGVKSVASGNTLFEERSGGRFSRSAEYLLVDQDDRRQAPARIVDAISGKVQWTLAFTQATARLRSGLELLLLDDDAQRLVVRRHDPRGKGLWFYER